MPPTNSRALVSASVAVSGRQSAPARVKRYRRLLPPPLAHTVSAPEGPLAARPSQAARKGRVQVTVAVGGTTPISPFSALPLLVTTTYPSVSVPMLSGRVTTVN